MIRKSNRNSLENELLMKMDGSSRHAAKYCTLPHRLKAPHEGISQCTRSTFETKHTRECACRVPVISSNDGCEYCYKSEKEKSTNFIQIPPMNVNQSATLEVNLTKFRATSSSSSSSPWPAFSTHTHIHYVFDLVTANC